jgi:hypothetical protein
VARVIPLSISSVFLKLGAQPFGLGGMDSDHDPVHHDPRSEVEVLYPGQDLRVKIVQGLTS